MMKIKKSDIASSVFFGSVIITCLVLTIVYRLNWLALVSCVASIVYVVFLSERNILNFIVGFVSSSTYIVVAYQSRLFGEALFYLIVDIPMIFVSFFLWRKHMETKLKVEPKKLSGKNIALISIAAAAVTVAYGFILRAIGGANPFVDALSTVVTCIATVLMALRYREQWIMWIIVYIVSIVLWATTFDLLMLIMSCSCFISSIIGFVNWSTTSRKENLQLNEKTLNK